MIFFKCTSVLNFSTNMRHFLRVIEVNSCFCLNLQSNVNSERNEKITRREFSYLKLFLIQTFSWHVNTFVLKHLVLSSLPRVLSFNKDVKCKKSGAVKSGINKSSMDLELTSLIFLACHCFL